MNARKILSEFNVGKYKVLKLDGEKPNRKYSQYLIDGVLYEIIPMYDAVNCIAIECSISLVGKNVEFVNAAIDEKIGHDNTAIE